MIISGHHKKFENIDIRIKDSPIIRTKSYKYLGVKIDQNLNYSQHINNLAGTVKNKIRSITRISHFLPKGMVMTLYLHLTDLQGVVHYVDSDMCRGGRRTCLVKGTSHQQTCRETAAVRTCRDH